MFTSQVCLQVNFRHQLRNSVTDDFMGIPLPPSYPNKADNKDTGNNDTPSKEHGMFPTATINAQ